MSQCHTRSVSWLFSAARLINNQIQLTHTATNDTTCPTAEDDLPASAVTGQPPPCTHHTASVTRQREKPKPARGSSKPRIRKTIVLEEGKRGAEDLRRVLIFGHWSIVSLTWRAVEMGIRISESGPGPPGTVGLHGRTLYCGFRSAVAEASRLFRQLYDNNDPPTCA